MPRKERREFAGGVYHVMDRGDRLEAIYEDDRMQDGARWGQCANIKFARQGNGSETC